MWCPKCGRQHIDEGEWAEREHRTHRCVGVDGCGHEWTPLEGVATVGVAKLEKVTVMFEGGPPGYIVSEPPKFTAKEVAAILVIPERK
jgi:hypothetical protein